MWLDQISAFKGPLVDLAVKKILGALATRLPFLASGPLGWLISTILSFIIGKVFDRSVKEAEIKWSAMQRDALVHKLQVLYGEYDNADEIHKERIENEIRENARDLITFNRVQSKSS